MTDPIESKSEESDQQPRTNFSVLYREEYDGFRTPSPTEYFEHDEFCGCQLCYT